MQAVHELADDDSRSVSAAANRFLSDILQEEDGPTEPEAQGEAAEQRAAEQAEREAAERRAAKRPSEGRARADPRLLFLLSAGALAVAGAVLAVIGLFPTYMSSLSGYSDSCLNDPNCLQPDLHRSVPLTVAGVSFLIGTAALCLAAGVCTLIPRARPLLGPRLLLATAAASTSALAFNLRHSFIVYGSYQAESGFWLQLASNLSLIVAACFAGLVLARASEVRLLRWPPRNTLLWIVVLLGVAGALALVFQDLELTALIGSQWKAAEVPSIVVTVWALVMPGWAAVVVPRRLGVALLVGWIWVGAAFCLYCYLFFGSVHGVRGPIIAFGLTLLALSAVTVPFARAAPSVTPRVTWGVSVKLGGNLRRKHPLGFFLWGMMLSVALVGTGTALLDEPTTTQPREAIGGILDGIGILLLAIVLVLGIVDLSRYLLRPSRGNGPAKKPKPQTQPGNLRPPGPGPQQQHGQQQQRPQQGPGDRPLAKRTVKILVVGYAASGKTLMLASLYHGFAHGTPAGIRFTTTDDESNRTLVDYATSIRDPRRRLPAGTQETKRWTFKVRVESGDQESDAFTLEYLDYAGGFIDRMLNSPNPALVEELDPTLKDELKSTDVLMGVLDGERLVKLMAGDYDVDVVGDIERLLNILIRTGHRNIHLVITKWDLMRAAGGAYYTISDVRQTLDRVSTAFQSFRKSPKLETSMRIIPVSALGVNGFVHCDPAVDGSVTRQPGVSWEPWNVQVPFFSAVPDILSSDVPELPSEDVGGISKIGLAVFSIADLIEVDIPLGIFHLKVPAGEVLQRVIGFVRGRNQRGMVPASLTAESALSYVLNESYAALDEFEARTRDSRVQQPRSYG